MTPSPTNTSVPSLTAKNKNRSNRARLSVACNQCRKRKVRCDASLPKCRNCVLRKEDCETSHPRHPWKGPSFRTLVNKDRQTPLGQNGNQSDSIEESTVDHEIRAHVDRSEEPSVAIQSSQQPSPSDESVPVDDEPRSWISRAYRYTAATDGTTNNGNDGSTPDLVVNTDATPYRVKFQGGSSLQCLCRFVDLHLMNKGLEPVSPWMKHGMPHSEEFPLPLGLTMPSLPPERDTNAYVGAFFDRVQPLFPVVDPATFQENLDSLFELQRAWPDTFTMRLPSTSVPFLVATYAIICIGADELSGCRNDVSTRYLAGAYSLYGHLVATPYTTTVQALFLLALALRGQTRDGQAWQVLGHAIRVAHSVGLHKQISQPCDPHTAAPSPGYQVNEQLHSQIWWSCYAFERLMQLESGRPSMLKDADADQLRFVESRTRPSPSHFAAWASLSRIMGEISDHLYSRRPESSLSLFQQVQRLDQSLVDWEKSLPDNLRVKQDILYDHDSQNSDHQHLMAYFLSMQFHFAHIELLRLSVVFPHNSYTHEVKKHQTALSSFSRLLNGANICSAAARATVTQAIHLADHGVRSVLFGVTPIFLSAVVLALGILRHPTRRLARADLELLNLATEHIEDHYSRWIENSSFVKISVLLRERVHAFLDHVGTERFSSPRNGAETRMRDSCGDMTGQSAPLVGYENEYGNLGTMLSSIGAGTEHDLSISSFEGLDFDGLWDMMEFDYIPK